MMRLSRTHPNKKNTSTTFGWNTVRYRTRIGSAVSLVLFILAVLYGSHISSSLARLSPIPRLSDNISIRAAGRGNPWINMTDGRDVLTAYEGPDDLVRLMSQNSARPLSLASADFDEDGMPDLIAGYGTARGGIIAMHRGNVDSVYPNNPTAKQHKAEGAFSDAPFLSPARMFEAGTAPEFVETGDFDADGHNDIALASRGDNSLYFMSGDGKGGFNSAGAVVLPGRVSAMASGDVNRADGMTDLVLAIEEMGSSKLMVFEGPGGAAKSSPESIDIPGEATSIKIAHLSDAAEAEVAIAVGSELLVVHGRDRKLYLNPRERKSVPEPTVTHHQFNANLTSLAIGDFTGDVTLDLGIAFDDGTVRLLSEDSASVATAQSRKGPRKTVIETLATNIGSAKSQLYGARLSSLSHETLVMADAETLKMHIWIDDADRRHRNDSTMSAKPGEHEKPVTLDVDEQPIAVLPMRLNLDGITDLVVLRQGHAAPGIMFSISSIKGVCNMSDCGSIGCGSLRAAIMEANSSPGSDVITFQNGTFDQIPTIQIGTPLPTLVEALTIDGAQAGSVSCGSAAASSFDDVGPQSLQGVQITTNNNISDAVKIASGGCVVRNLVINRVGNGIHVESSTQSFIEGNFIGVNIAGSEVSQNSARGVFVDNAARNTIGGNAQAINVISGNAIGIDISGGNATDNLVRFNNIGASANAGQALGNRGNGVRITNNASRNRIGASVTGGRDNAIYGSSTDGVAILSGTGNLVQANLFQVNQANGVSVSSPGNTVGGAGRPFANFIWSSVASGVEINGAAASNNLVQGNRIGLDFDNNGNAIDVGRHNNGHGVALTNNASGNVVGDATDGSLGNFIAFNQLDGVSVVLGTGNRILANSIFSNAGLGIDLGNDGRDTNDDKDGDSGANNKQNFPVLVSANVPTVSPEIARFRPAATVSIRVSLNSTPNQNFDISFYHCSNPCTGSGDQFSGCIPRFLGTRTVATGADGNVSQDFSFDLGTGVSTGFLNATATNSTTGDTSEFSTCAQIGACSFSANPPTRTVGANSGSDSFNITAASGCAWTAASNAPWLTTSSTGNGNGTVNYSYAENTTGSERSGTISVGNATHVVTQTAAAAGPSISSACRGDGKHLLVNGSGFQEGAKVFLNGEQEKTSFVSSTQVFAKKAGKRAATGDTLSVRNPDGTQTPVFPYTKNSCATP